jgi:hypothetical protein
MPQDQLSNAEFAAKIKAKYPQYKSVPDNELTAKIVAKHPEYKSSLKEFTAPNTPKKEGFASALGSDIAGMAKGVVGSFGDALNPVASSYKLAQQVQGMVEHDTARKDDGRSGAYRVAAGAGELLGVNSSGMEDAAKKGDVGGILGHAAAVPVVTAASEGLARGVPGAVDALKNASERGLPPAITKAATQKVVQDILHERGLKVRDHLQDVANLVKKEDGERWQHIEKTIDEARPDGAIDMTGLRRSTQDSVEGTIQTPQKLPATVDTMRKGSEVPRIGGDRLDLSNPSHKALYDRLKEAGAFPGDDMASFGEARQIRSKLGRELRSGTSTLSGESKSVGWKLYSDLTNAMKASADEHGMAGAFEDANKFHQQYMEDFVDKDAPLGKALNGANASEVMEPLSSPKTAAQVREVMKKYDKHGIDPKKIDKEGQVFQKLSSGLPRQLQMRPYEILGAGTITAAREGYNLAQRVGAIREVNKPNPLAARAQALKAAADKLGPRATVKEIMKAADEASPPPQ